MLLGEFPLWANVVNGQILKNNQVIWSQCGERKDRDRHRRHQYDQIKRFLKALGSKFAIKIRPKKIGDFWAVLKRSIYVLTAVDIMWATFGNISATFFSTFWSH